MMKAKEIRNMTTEELEAKVAELKKDIARIKTIIREKQTEI